MSIGNLDRRMPRLAARAEALVEFRAAGLLAAMAVTAIVLGIRLALASKVQFCGGADACFYFSLAREIVSRHDFLLNFVWNYQVEHIQLPSVAVEYWRPGTSLLLVLAAAFGDITLHFDAVVATIATILAALAAAELTWTLTRNRWITLLGYTIGLCLPSYWTLALNADSAVFYGAAVGWFLVLFTPVDRSPLRDLAAILCVAMAYLIRNDAIILVVPFAAVLAMRAIDQRRSGNLRHELSYSLWLAAAFLLALLPTHLLIWYATGHFSNSSTTIAVLFFRDLADFSRYDGKMDFASWWATGFGHLLHQRLAALVQIIHHLLVRFSEPATVMALAAVTAILLPRPRARFSRILIGPGAFLISIVLVYAIVFPGIGDHSASRSYTGMLPVLAALAATGIAAAFTAPRAMMVALAVGIVGFSALDGINQARTALDDGRKDLAVYQAEARIVRAMSPDPRSALAMVQNPAVFTTATGIASISLPTDGPAAIRKAAGDFNATAIVADKWSDATKEAGWLRDAPRQDVPDSRMEVISLPPDLGSGDR